MEIGIQSDNNPLVLPSYLDDSLIVRSSQVNLARMNGINAGGAKECRGQSWQPLIKQQFHI